MERVVIVTGGSQGLGRCVVDQLLSHENTKVVVIARNEKLLKQLEDDVGDANRLLVVTGDVRDEKLIDKMLGATLMKFGRIDSVVFNAGVLKPVGHLSDAFDIDQMKELFDINYFSIVMLINKLLTRLPGQQLRFVFVSSGASTRGIDGWLAYGNSKAAVNALCKQLHDEMYPQIQCISVAPGVVNTDMQRQIREDLGGNMTAKSHQRFLDLFENNELLDGHLVGETYARLAINGCSDHSVYGEYVRWNDERLKDI